MKVELYNITKKFGDVTANSEISLKIDKGEVVALLGENGAGKSTLMKVLFGIYTPDEGAILINDKETAIDSPQKAMSLGIGMVFQQFNLIPALSVLDNLLLAYPKAPFWTFRGRFTAPGARSRQILDNLSELAPGLDPHSLVSHLSVGQRQLLELIKVLNLDAQLLILDEPTSVLPPQEAERLWGMIRKLGESGRSVVLITHKMHDVMACADRVVVMRGGELIKTLPRDACTEESLVQLMMGERSDRAPIRTPEAESLLSQPAQVLVKQLVAHQAGQFIGPIDLEIKPGEILGIAGVSGNGQHLLADALVGLAPLTGGEVIIDGVVVQSALGRSGPSGQVSYIPEQPAVNAVAADLSLTVNVALGHYHTLKFFPHWAPEQATTESILQDYQVRPPKPSLPAGQLSGGNLQKLVVGRELLHQRALIVAAYPTMGLDAGAAHDIYQALFQRATTGACVLWISEDLDDLMEYAHRIAVIEGGRIAGIFDPQSADRLEIGRAMTSDSSSFGAVPTTKSSGAAALQGATQ